DETTAFVIPLHQPPKRARKSAERAKAHRQRRKKPSSTDVAAPSSEDLIPLEFLSEDAKDAAAAVRAAAAATVSDETAARHAPTVAAGAGQPRRAIASWVLAGAALALAGVGIVINGWFARSLGSTEAAGLLFLAVGVATDLVALAAPSCGAHLWGAGQRATSLVAWVVWLMTFIFAVTAGGGVSSPHHTAVELARPAPAAPP